MLLKEFYETKLIVETVNDYLSLVVSQINTRKPQDLFKAGDPKSLDLDHLSMIVTGLKIIAEPDFRTAITKRDVGFNPNDAKELLNVLIKIDKQGKDPVEIQNAFKALCKLAPGALKTQRQELEILKAGDDSERRHAAQELQKLVLRTSQFFNKVKTSAQSTRGVDVPTLGRPGSIDVNRQ